MNNLIVSEYQECKTFWQWVCVKGYADDVIKNANERMGDTGWFIRALYAIGFRKGLPDYHYIVRNNHWSSLWIEVKRRDQRTKKQRPEQVEWQERLRKRGHAAEFAYGCDDAIQIFERYVSNDL